jgi:hypothetical protein
MPSPADAHGPDSVSLHPDPGAAGREDLSTSLTFFDKFFRPLLFTFFVIVSKFKKSLFGGEKSLGR